SDRADRANAGRYLVTHGVTLVVGARAPGLLPPSPQAQSDGSVNVMPSVDDGHVWAAGVSPRASATPAAIRSSATTHVLMRPSVSPSAAASRADHGVDAGTRRLSRTVLGRDELP